MRHRAASVLVALVAQSAAAANAGTDPLAEGLRHCAHEADEHQRLVCFDALASALPQIKSDQFGMTADVARRRSPAAAPAVAPAATVADETLAGTIAGLSQSADGKWVFTLDNAQRWIETDPKGLHFTVGEHVLIAHGALSALWLKADHHRQTRVKRLQ